jgi:hypothetical protein
VQDAVGMVGDDAALAGGARRPAVYLNQGALLKK